MKKSFLSIIAITAAMFTASASAASYNFSHTPAPSKIMDSYSTTWNENTETLSIDSSWDTSADITRIKFLISDGGSPHLTGKSTLAEREQFLFYDLDLTSNTLQVQSYYGRTLLETFTGAADGIMTTANSLSLSIDHSYLNSLTADYFAGFSSYNGAGFSEDIGIWYYMYGPDITGELVLKETLDIHHGTPSEVPVPAALFLFAPVLAGLVAKSESRSSGYKNGTSKSPFLLRNT